MAQLMAQAMAIGEEEVVTTIRVINVPSHTSESEFNCWFLFADGFEQATLVPTRGTNQSQLGWARFSTEEAALAAIEHLNGRQLTEDQSPENIALSADLAKSNFRPSYGNRKRATAPEPAPQMHYAQAPVTQSHAAELPAATALCSTLFVGGLQPGCSELELNQFFRSNCTGFERLKYVPPGEKPGICFVKFSFPEQAEAALQVLSLGYSLPSNPGTAIQAEFANNDLDQPSFSRTSTQGIQSTQLPATRSVLPRTAVTIPAPPTTPPPGQALLDSTVQSSNPPCDTIFVGQLSPTATEYEVSSVLASMPGFMRMKLVGEGSAKPFALGLYDSVESCANAIQSLAGVALASAPTQALSFEYSKNSLDKRQRTS